MEALEKRVEDMDTRLRIVEQSNSSIATTLTHFTATVDTFINTLKTHEEKEDKRFEKFENTIANLQKVAYIGLGALAILQFLIANGIVKFGG